MAPSCSASVPATSTPWCASTPCGRCPASAPTACITGSRWGPCCGSRRGLGAAPLLARASKGDYSADFYASLHHHRADLVAFLADSLLADRGLIDASALRAALLAPHPTPWILSPLVRTLACEAWLRSLRSAARRDGSGGGGG
ncbi:hypothetical protein ACTWP5_11340 [Streptomyces sp. 4N509B]|uniref:hypothetical protein n=1 Tax=Streptomyces sp. 4N509B TaxID=3457413 RepID=UPI003FCF0C2D